MKIKAKLRKIGNSVGVLLPREVITGIKLGEEVELDVITNLIKTPMSESEIDKKYGRKEGWKNCEHNHDGSRPSDYGRGGTFCTKCGLEFE